MILRPTLSLLLRVAWCLSVASSALGSALTTTVAPGEKLCFYADVDKAGEKIGVSPLSSTFAGYWIGLTAHRHNSSITP